MAINMGITQGLFHETIKANQMWLQQIQKPIKSK